MSDTLGSRVIDDCGLLAIVDCAAYASHIGEDWTYESIVAHFVGQMALHHMLVWDCGDGGGDYGIAVRSGFTTRRGFREIEGMIAATAGQLHIVSYDALTMAAQFSDEKLPQEHERGLVIPVPIGTHRVRIVQMYDPQSLDALPEPAVLVEIENGAADVWTSIAWLKT